MCEPTAAMAALAVAGSAINAYGKTQQLKAESQSMEYQAEIMEKNAAYSEQQAKDAEVQAKDAVDRGALKSHRYRLYVNRVLSKQKTAFAASGVALGGTPSNVMRDTAVAGETDALTIEHNAAMQAWGLRGKADAYRQQGSNYIDQSRLLSFGAGEKSRLAPIAGWGTLLTGASQTALMFGKNGWGGTNNPKPDTLPPKG